MTALDSSWSDTVADANSKLSTANHQPPTAQRAQHPQRPPRSQPPPYRRGQYDRLVDPPVHADPDDIRGVTFEVAGSGLSIIATELTSSGKPVRHLIRDDEWPYFIDIKLPDGREVQVEARIFEPVAGPPEKRRYNRKAAAPVEQAAPTNPTPALVKASLHRFASAVTIAGEECV